jgi:hypothetical protein
MWDAAATAKIGEGFETKPIEISGLDRFETSKR